jgi:hypothetical protein
MTGMNLRTVAEVTTDRIAAGAALSEVAAGWRVITPESSLAQKLPGGASLIQKLRQLSGE